MSTTTTKPTTTKKATRPAGFTKNEWETKTNRVYDGLIKLSEGKIIAPQFVNHPVVKELMERCCGAKTPEQRWKLAFSLFVHMDNYGTKDGEKVLKVKGFSTLRQWFNGGYAEKIERPVTYRKAPEKKAKKASPKEKKPVKKVQNVSVAQWVKGLTEDQIDQLKVEIAMRDMAA